MVTMAMGGMDMGTTTLMVMEATAHLDTEVMVLVDMGAMVVDPPMDMGDTAMEPMAEIAPMVLMVDMEMIAMIIHLC